MYSYAYIYALSFENSMAHELSIFKLLRSTHFLSYSKEIGLWARVRTQAQSKVNPL